MSGVNAGQLGVCCAGRAGAATLGTGSLFPFFLGAMGEESANKPWSLIGDGFERWEGALETLQHSTMGAKMSYLNAMSGSAATTDAFAHAQDQNCCKGKNN